ncbi:MAG: hypothetical protein IRZ29_07145 [Thermoflavifilum sp.]|nr:hypothetical protein [Thermoflavifilum sp.]
MKQIAKGLMVLLLAGALSTGPVPHRASAAPPHISIQVFFDALSPYGHWVTYGSYGYAWVPAVEVGFIPYATAGHWVFTSLGWTWVSDYPWGWAPFHYGRWIYDDYYGWIWIPGTEWAPAWVVWAQSDGYYGWAPLPPGVDISVHIAIGRYIPYSRWVFVPGAYLCAPAPYRYYVYPREHVTIVQHITVINQVYVERGGPRYFYGPRPEVVQRYLGRPLRPVAIVDASRPEETRMEGNAVRIFRPAVQQVPNAAPRTFVDPQQASRLATNEHVRFMSPFSGETRPMPTQESNPRRVFTPAGNASPSRNLPASEAGSDNHPGNFSPAAPQPAEPPMRMRRFNPVPVDRTPSSSGFERRTEMPDSRNMAPARVFKPAAPNPSYSPSPQRADFHADAFRRPIMHEEPTRSFNGGPMRPSRDFGQGQGREGRRHF